MVHKILLVDDDPDMREMLAELIMDAGYSVVLADNGEDAVAKASKELPALVLMDIHMPKMDGLEACRRIKSDPITKAVPVVMLTVEGSIGEIKQAIDYGARTYLTKPSSREEILKVIKSILA